MKQDSTCFQTLKRNYMFLKTYIQARERDKERDREKKPRNAGIAQSSSKLGYTYKVHTKCTQTTYTQCTYTHIKYTCTNTQTDKSTLKVHTYTHKVHHTHRVHRHTQRTHTDTHTHKLDTHTK